MAHVIQAVFENGVFKPLQSVTLHDRERVELKVVSIDEWQTRFREVIQRVRARASDAAPDEIEEDIGLARREVRRAR